MYSHYTLRRGHNLTYRNKFVFILKPTFSELLDIASVERFWQDGSRKNQVTMSRDPNDEKCILCCLCPLLARHWILVSLYWIPLVSISFCWNYCSKSTLQYDWEEITCGWVAWQPQTSIQTLIQKSFQMSINFHLPFLRDTYFDTCDPILNK